MIDRTQYTVGVPAEDLSLYVPGGYHPIHINDRLKDGRYEILNKLGFGSFSTVWLARDHQNHRNVSVKIVVAKQSEKENKELQVLQHIKAIGDSSHPGYKHVSQLLDSFQHDGPNGRHSCIVQELLGPKASIVAEKFPNYRLDGNLARKVSRQLLLAVDFLHSCGVAHGDIHMGNVLFRLTEYERASDEQASQFSSPIIGSVSRKDGTPLDEGLPNHAVEPLEHNMTSKEHLNEIQLIDLGESFFITSPPKSICTPMSLHPPELVFQHTLSEAVDIWNLGSTTYELVTGRTLFEAVFEDRTLIPQFQRVLGDLPVQWVLDAINNGVLKERPAHFSAEGFETLEVEVDRSYLNGYEPSTLQLNHTDLKALKSYLRKMLVVDPNKRATSKELCHEEWISMGS